MSAKLLIDTEKQHLKILRDGVTEATYRISSAKNGTGQDNGTGCTPLGRHTVKLRIGADCPANTVFVARRPTGEIYTADLANKYPERDWILSRILWLAGVESGFNRGADCDTLKRFIYIHGCPDSEPMGIPASHGCIRMRNADIIELFEQVHNGMQVDIC